MGTRMPAADALTRAENRRSSKKGAYDAVGHDAVVYREPNLPTIGTRRQSPSQIEPQRRLAIQQEIPQGQTEFTSNQGQYDFLEKAYIQSPTPSNFGDSLAQKTSSYEGIPVEDARSLDARMEGIFEHFSEDTRIGVPIQPVQGQKAGVSLGLMEAQSSLRGDAIIRPMEDDAKVYGEEAFLFQDINKDEERIKALAPPSSQEPKRAAEQFGKFAPGFVEQNGQKQPEGADKGLMQEEASSTINLVTTIDIDGQTICEVLERYLAAQAQRA